MKTSKTSRNRKTKKRRTVRKSKKSNSRKMRASGLMPWRFVQWLQDRDDYFRHEAMTEYRVMQHPNGQYMVQARNNQDL